MMYVDDGDNENENYKWMFKTTSFLPLLLPLE